MDINSYLSSLGDKLKALGVSDSDIEKQLRISRNYLNSLDETELTETLNDKEQINIIAVNIAGFIQKKKAKLLGTQEIEKVKAAGEGPTPADDSRPIIVAGDYGTEIISQRQSIQPITDRNLTESHKPFSPASEETAADATIADETLTDDIAENESPMHQFIPADLPDEKRKPEKLSSTGSRPAIRKYNTSETTVGRQTGSFNRARRDITSEQNAIKQSVPEHADESLPMEQLSGGEIQEAGYSGEYYQEQFPSADEYQFDEIYETEKIRGSALFWVLFIAALPLTALIYLTVFMVFGALFAVVAALIVVLIALLIADVAVGTAISLVGIIYGITQLFSTVPIGLYELGLGLLAGGVCMFSAIIIYNIAIRFLPFTLKKLTTLLQLIIGSLKDLYYSLKRRSSDIDRGGEIN
ncbi:MAG: hypothetical protein ACOX4O_01925 [Eubacteriales bacterium]